jgi:hypothetical protein
MALTEGNRDIPGRSLRLFPETIQAKHSLPLHFAVLVRAINVHCLTDPSGLSPDSISD